MKNFLRHRKRKKIGQPLRGNLKFFEIPFAFEKKMARTIGATRPSILLIKKINRKSKGSKPKNKVKSPLTTTESVLVCMEGGECPEPFAD